MHRFHGLGRHFGGGWGFGWFLPGIILGELISNNIPRQPGWSYPPPANLGPLPTGPAPAQTESQSSVRCQKCDQTVNAKFDFCPHCGTRLAPRACGYCGQTLERGVTYCTKCGGPAR